MEAAHGGVDALDAAEALGVARDVDHASVAAAGDDHQGFVLHVNDCGLVVVD
jgi:hypothetical protein